jgi:hypothetical protein
MARTESKTFSCHPDNAQREIDLHQKFHWSLLSSQDVKTIDNSLETRVNTLYNVRKSEHYVKLTFSRDLDTPNLNEIKKLEATYYELAEPRRGENTKFFIEKKVSTAFVCYVYIIAIVLGLYLWCFTSSFIIGFLIGCIIVFIIGFASERSMERFNAPRVAAHKAECKRITQEYEQDMKNFHQQRREILAEVEKYS